LADTKLKAKILGIALVWLFLAAVVAPIIKWWFIPAQKEKEEQLAVAHKEEIIENTSSHRRFDNVVSVMYDSFSGYAVLRSPEFSRLLNSESVDLVEINDNADYKKRMEYLASGKTNFAVFPIDAFLTACNDIQDIPATIILVVDETKGADAVVGYKNKYPTVDSLNDPNLKFVLTPDSPSETLVNIMKTYFDLSKVSKDCFVQEDGANEVYKKWRSSSQNDSLVYVLWEPYVTKILENPNMHVIMDSSKFRGYIVDVLVVNRDFLYKNQDLTKKFIECYLKASYENSKNMNALVKQDALDVGDALSDKQVENLTKGIWWKNVQENYAHMGLRQGHSLQHIEDMIGQISNVLEKTRDSYKDPTNGHYEKLYYNQILKDLKDNSFHPGMSYDSTGKIRDEVSLRELNPEEWNTLQPIGTLKVPSIKFARGSSVLTRSAKKVLDNLAKNLETWPTYYVSVIGNASTKGNIESNRKLSESRAQVAYDYILSKGIDPVRIRFMGSKPSGSSSVNFVLGQLPY